MKVALWKLQIILLDDKTLVSGIVVKGKPKVQSEKDKTLGTFNKVLRSYFLRPLKNHSIFLKYKGDFIPLQTGKNGEFEKEINTSTKGKIGVYLTKESENIPLLQDYPVRFENVSTKFLVISDIDDTILQSYSTKSIKKLRRILFHAPIKRKRIEATYQAFKRLHQSHFHFIYLSRSEYNLFNLITTFIVENKLPIGPVLLRKFTPWKKLLNQKGKKQFKYDVLDDIISQFPNNKIVFFGDDSQFDLDIYIHFAKLFPDEVGYIFIHRTMGIEGNKEIEWNLDTSYINDKVVFFSHFEEVEEYINLLVNEAVNYN